MNTPITAKDLLNDVALTLFDEHDSYAENAYK